MEQPCAWYGDPVEVDERPARVQGHTDLSTILHGISTPVLYTPLGT